MKKLMAGVAVAMIGVSQGWSAECKVDASLPLSSHTVTVIAQDHHSVSTDIIINAPASEVWKVLTDFTNMPNWSSSLQGMSGEIKDGGAATVVFKMPGADAPVNIPHVIKYKEGEEFGWSEDLTGLAPGISDNHSYRVEAISECQSRFIQSDAFKGVSAEKPEMTTALFADMIVPIYRKFNEELKAEVEK